VAKEKRVKRDAPARTGPVRNRALRLEIPPPPTGSSYASAVGAAIGTVERGVETAYAVIEEYMLRGRQAAGGYHERTGETDMNRNQFGGGQWGGGQWGGGQWGGMNNPMMNPWMNMMSLWAQTMGAFMQQGQAGGDWSSCAPAGCAPPGSPAHVSIQVTSAQPAEVAVDLQPGADMMTLTADPLTLTADVAPITTTAFDCHPGHVRFRIVVPPTQPTGVYTGVVRDSARLERGRVVVTITPQSTPAPSPVA
jgi:hypothetical protein